MPVSWAREFENSRALLSRVLNMGFELGCHPEVGQDSVAYFQHQVSPSCRSVSVSRRENRKRTQVNLHAELSGGEMRRFILFALLPIQDPRTRFFCGILKIFEISRTVTVAGFPAFFFVFVAQLNRRSPEGALGVLILPDTDVYRTVDEFVDRAAIPRG